MTLLTLFRPMEKHKQSKIITVVMLTYDVISVLLATVLCCEECGGQTIGFENPNFGLPYNPYTSSQWGYGLGPQFSTVHGALAAGLMGGPAAFGEMPLHGLAMTGFTGGMPYGPYASYAFPGMASGAYNQLGPWGRYPGVTGTLGYGSYQGYGVYNGYGSYPGMGGFGPGSYFGTPNDYSHYIHNPPDRDSASSSSPSLPSGSSPGSPHPTHGVGSSSSGADLRLIFPIDDYNSERQGNWKGEIIR